MSRNKELFFILSFLILYISCGDNISQIIDIDNPELNFVSIQNNNILFQFNEPITSAVFFINGSFKEKEIKIFNKFPVSNIYLSGTYFSNDIKISKLKVEAIDSSGNKLTSIINSPVLNLNPADIKIKEVLLKYSKKKNQQICLKADKSGNLAGYSLVIFNSKSKIIIPFEYNSINLEDELAINFDLIKNAGSNYSLNFNKKQEKIVISNRLSIISSLIMLLNNKDEVVDYLLYYNSKKHSLAYYNSDRNFMNYKNELIQRKIEPKPVDISDVFFQKKSSKAK
jgi:hypothetical protein